MISNNTLRDLFFFSNELKLLVLPSPLGREGERLLCAISAKDINRYIYIVKKTVVSTKTDNSNQRFFKSLAYSNHIVSILLAYTWHIKSIFRHMVSICILYANYMPSVWERYAIIIASLL
jgi:hypothetical protein